MNRTVIRELAHTGSVKISGDFSRARGFAGEVEIASVVGASRAHLGTPSDDSIFSVR